MPRQLVIDSSSGGQIFPRLMTRRNPDGSWFQIQTEKEEYFQAAPRMRARYMLHGISDEFEMKNTFPDSKKFGQMEAKVLLEFKIEEGLTNTSQAHEGQLFFSLLTMSTWSTANFRQFFDALNGSTIPDGGFDPDQFIGWSFVSSTRGQQGDKNKFGGMSIDFDEDSIVPFVPTKAKTKQPARQLATVGAPNDDENEDPFATDDD